MGMLPRTMCQIPGYYLTRAPTWCHYLRSAKNVNRDIPLHLHFPIHAFGWCLAHPIFPGTVRDICCATTPWLPLSPLRARGLRPTIGVVPNLGPLFRCPRAREHCLFPAIRGAILSIPAVSCTHSTGITRFRHDGWQRSAGLADAPVLPLGFLGP
jgi:hypothetical protein